MSSIIPATKALPVSGPEAKYLKDVGLFNSNFVVRTPDGKSFKIQTDLNRLPTTMSKILGGVIKPMRSYYDNKKATLIKEVPDARNSRNEAIIADARRTTESSVSDSDSVQ